MKNRIISEWNEIKIAFPKLGDLYQKENFWKSQGKIDIIDSSGILWRTFTVKIIIPNNYPESLPLIYETNGDIPKEAEWHINPDGSCCVGPNTKIYRKLEYKLTLKRWMDLIVIPYLYDQVYKLEKGEYKGKVHAHGKRGLLDDYKEWWGLEKDELVINKLKLITGQIKIGRNDPCFCGKNIKYKKCHLYAKTFDNIPIHIYHKDLRSILD